MQAQVSFHRLEEFLKLGELQPDNVIRNMPSPHCKLHVTGHVPSCFEPHHESEA